MSTKCSDAMRVAAACMVWLAAGHATAAAPGWTASIGADAAGTYLTGKPRVVVVPAGQELTDEAKAVASALRGALNKSGRTSLVMDSAALGDVSELADEEIVMKAARLPVDVVAVVRVFPRDASRAAVVTFYSKKKAVISAFQVERGQKLAAHVAGSPGSGASGVSAAASTTVQNVMRDAGAPERDQGEARRKFNRSYLAFDDWVGINQHGVVVARWSNPYRGKQHQMLEGDEFFRIAGHPELAESYTTRRRARIALLGGGGVVTAVGLVVTLAGIFSKVDAPLEDELAICEDYDNRGNCVRRSASNRPMFYGGIGVMSVGALAMIVGAFIPAYPVDANEASNIARRYNESLRKKLGLPSDTDGDDGDDGEGGGEQSRRAVPGPTISLSPSLGPSGGGLSLIGTF